VLLVHAGNRIDLANRSVARFPSSQVPAVRDRVGRLLDSLRPSGVVSAAAAGADLIVLEEAIRRGLDLHVIMPIAPDEFVAESVVDAGAEWVDRFDGVLRHISTHPRCSVTQGEGKAGDAWYLAANDELLDRAAVVAGSDIIVALAVRPPEGENPPSVTDDFVARAGRSGLLVMCIDPRPGSTASVTVS
jgi:hypothetical protein